MGDPPGPPVSLVDVTPDPWPAAILAQPVTTNGARRLEIGGATADGHLLLSYGDYTPNTGPIDVIGYRPSDGDVVTYFDNADTEELWTFRRDYLGKVWVPPIDPRGGNVAKVYTDRTGAWVELTCQADGVPVMVHAYDLVPPTATDPNAYVCGSRALPGNPSDTPGDAACVWRSGDNGATWVEVVADVSPLDGFHRFYGFGKIGETLYVSADRRNLYLHPSSGVPRYWRGQGDTWELVEGMDLAILFPPVWSASSFASRAVVYAEAGGTLVNVIADVAPGLWNPIDASLEDDDYLYTTNAPALRSSSAGFLGRLTGTPVDWRGIVSPADGELYLSNRSGIYRAEL